MKKRKIENRNKATERAIFIRELKPCLRDSRHRPFNHLNHTNGTTHPALNCSQAQPPFIDSYRLLIVIDRPSSA